MNLYIFGAGGHAKVVAESALGLKSFAKILFIDENDHNKNFIFKNPNFSLIRESELPNNFDNSYAIVGIGDNKTRHEVVNKCYKIPFITVASSDAIVSQSVVMSSGSFIGPGAIINADARIGDHTIINTRSVVEHDCIIGNFCHIGPSATISGGVKLGKCVFVGGGAYINPNVSVCDNVIIGSGSLVINDIEESGTYVGSPVKKIN